MNICYLSLGSNQKCPERQIRMAIQHLKIIPKTYIKKCSSLHWSKAWGLTRQQDFCNIVVKIATTLSPEQLLACCQDLEKKQSRSRKKRWGPRTLDIDIILYGDRTIKTKNLNIPHPHYLTRSFVTIPLNECF